MVRVLWTFVPSSLARFSYLWDTNMLLRRRRASEHQKETLDDRDGIALARHLRARARCSPLEEDSLLDAILLLGNEHLGAGRKRPHQP